jgi:spermidine/putrescine transport system permease protein
MKRGSLPLWLISTFLYVFMYAPLAVVIIFSFNAAKHGGPWTGFTTDWYTSLLADQQKQDATWNTLILAAVSTVIATALGTMLGYGLSRYWFPGKKTFSLLMYIPVMIPDIVMAVAMLAFFKLLTEAVGFLNMGLATMTIAHITFQIPFVAIVVRSRLAGMDPAIEEAAHDLGASTWQTFWNITFPLMVPGVLAGGMLAFTLSLDDFVVSFFTTGPGATTLPILIYSSVKRGITPDINALSTLIVLASVLGTIGVTVFQRPRQPSGG